MTRTAWIIITLLFTGAGCGAGSEGADAGPAGPGIDALHADSGATVDAGPTPIVDAGPIPTGSSLADLAAEMQPGTWAELATSNIDTVLGSGGSSLGITSFANSAAWDPVTQRLYFTGGDHNDDPKFVSYDAPTNAWEVMPLPPFLSGIFPQWHAYDMNTIDVAGRAYYVGLERYDLTGGTWDRLPDVPGVSFGRAQLAVEYAPGLGGLVAVGNDAAYLYRSSTEEWETLATGLAFTAVSGCTGCDPIAEYSPAHELVWFGGGDGSRQLYRRGAAGPASASTSAPIDVGVYFGPVTVDPVSGDYLVFGQGGEFYVYDAEGDTWDNANSAIPVTDTTQLITSPIIDHGVTMFVQRASDFHFKVWLYKHTSGDGE